LPDLSPLHIERRRSDVRLAETAASRVFVGIFVGTMTDVRQKVTWLQVVRALFRFRLGPPDSVRAWSRTIEELMFSAGFGGSPVVGDRFW